MSTVTVTVKELSDKGEGVAFTDEGQMLFIPDALPGETLTVTVGEPFVRGSARSPATAVQLLQAHPERCEPFCEHFGKCGGCALQNLSLNGQHRLKEAQIVRALESQGLSAERFIPFRESELTLPCRFKSIRSFALDESGKVVSGFYRPRSHEVIAIEHCPLECSWFGDFVHDFTALLNSVTGLKDLALYDETTGYGRIRHLVLRDGGLSGERMAVIVGRDAPPRHVKQILSELALAHHVKLFFAVNDSEGNDILGEEVSQLSGEGALTAHLYGRDYKVGPLSFLQVNYEAASYLYDRAVKWCAAVGGPGAHAVDLFSGVGTLTLSLSPYFGHVTGVEIVREAVDCARENAFLNHVDNVSFIDAPVDTTLPLLGDPALRAVIADPSRRGLGYHPVKALAALKGPVRLALIYCSLKPVARELNTLIGAGYVLKEVEGIDLFPHTLHVETVVLMSRVKD
ncbi:MAG TPA: 23S rRNA (uracil(1939)-C(5))-methyltransferase RlmD [Candidatus Avisuccinivibrio pullicola]|nr:23S rRNA (uracil(1939)-C(5))-methyltransferase RlmD [Candidatus Avisuccinivibrio pullicola]